MQKHDGINILLLAFNRLEETTKVVDALSVIEKANVYVSVDGPRNDEDRRIQQKIINYVAERLGADVQFQVLHKNYGCRAGVTLGITWFFTKVSRGIIVEG